ncbi:MAG TPA: class I SAM-dependent methyltransferase [Cyclobacteriaceae bacterium]|jgi:SAM-dependent methyltransferase|nr:class I SAM-dependent methyltransferase [Cyclobacteriaceae bacterium]
MLDSEIQKKYYAETASEYDKMHIEGADEEHVFSLHLLLTFIKRYNIKSILDVGAGTGRTINFIRNNCPEVKIIGIEPVEELRLQGHKKGISKDILIDGDGNKIKYENGEFDLVCEFGVLHHVRYPEAVVGEMLRVSNKLIFISDSNNFGQGSLLGRACKQLIDFFGLWKAYNYFSTRGKMYHISEGDGLFYSYSVFNNYAQIQKACKLIHLVNTKDGGANLYRTASHLALIGVKA